MKASKQKARMSNGKAKYLFHPFLLPGHRRSREFESKSTQVVSKIGQSTIVRDTPGKSISHFQLAEKIALECRKTGRPIDELTRKWIEIPEWTDEREREEIQKFFRPNDDPWRVRRLACKVLLCGSSASAQALGTMAEECLSQLQVVANSIYECEMTSAHASIAAEQLARVIGRACSEMNELALKHPRIFHRFSRKDFWKWPVMKSTYPEFGDDEASLLAGLQLGKDLPLRLDRKAQWARGIKDDAGKIAWHLLWYVWGARSENNRWGIDYGDFGKMADALPPLVKNSAPKWWEAAKAVLLTSYPKPLEVAELADLVKHRQKRRYPSRLEEAIFFKLEKRFLSFAKKSPADFPT